MRNMLRQLLLQTALFMILLLPTTAYAAWGTGAQIRNYSPYNEEVVDGTMFTVVYDSEDHGVRYQCISQSIYSESNQSENSKTTCVITDQNGGVLDSSEYSIQKDDSYVSIYILQPASGTYTIEAASTWYFGYGNTTKTCTFTLVIQPAELKSLMSIAPYRGEYDGRIHDALCVTTLSDIHKDQYDVEYSTNGGKTYSDAMPRVSAVGNYSVVVRVTSRNENFVERELLQECVAEITARKVTLVPDAVSKVYGEADPVLTYQAAGELADELVAGVVLKRELGEDIGSYLITVDVVEGLNPNYEISCATSELVITPIPMTVNVKDIETCFEEGNEYQLDLKVADYKGNDISDQVKIQYSVDNGEYSEQAPSFAETGNHVVAYIVEKEMHVTVTGKVKVNIYAHNIVVEPAVEATCTTDGKTEGQYCSVCQTVFVASEVVMATGHPNTTTFAEEPATCTSTGLSKGVYCADCDTWLVERKTLAKVDHIEVEYEMIGSTCTESGWIRGSYCQVCNVSLSERLEIPAIGHNPVSEPAVAPTCTEPGYTKREYCKFCGEVYTAKEEIPALGHTIIVCEAVAPTCTESGITKGEVCSFCGVVLLEQEVIPLLPHSEHIMAGIEPTCTQTGMTEGFDCSVCGTILIAQTEIPLLPHAVVAIPAVEVTCAEPGYTEGTKCSVCQLVLEVPVERPAAHVKVIDKAAVLPSCTEAGWTEQSHCSRCGAILAESVILQATGHDVVIDPYVAPTLESSGWTEGSHCQVCNMVLVKQEEIPMKNVDTLVLNLAECMDVTLPYGYVRHNVIRTFDRLFCNQSTDGVITSGYCYIDDTDRLISIYRFLSPWEPWRFANEFENAGLTAVGVKYSSEKIAYAKGCYIAGKYDLYFVGFSTETARYIVIASSSTNISYEDGENLAESLRYDHQFATTTKQATCNENGSIVQKCKSCGKVESEVIIPASHSLITIPAVEPTCVKSGLTQGECCMVCGVITLEQETVAPLQHSVVVDTAVEPTCGAVGWTEGSHCSVCGVVLKEQIEIPKTTEHVFGEKEVIKHPSESEVGIWAQTCVLCGFAKVGPIPVTGAEQQRLPGDATADGNVDLDDAVCILQYASGENVTINLVNANVNVDDMVDIYDALLIMQYEAGWNVALR